MMEWMDVAFRRKRRKAARHTTKKLQLNAANAALSFVFGGAGEGRKKGREGREEYTVKTIYCLSG